MGALLFAGEHKGMLPITDWYGTSDVQNMRWYHRLYRYLHPERLPWYPLLRCPSVEALKPRTHHDPSILGANVDFVCLYAAPPTLPEGRPIYLHQLRDPSKVGLILEGNGPSAGGPYSERTFDMLVDAAALERHNGSINMVYCDGHAAKVHRPRWGDMFPH